MEPGIPFGQLPRRAIRQVLSLGLSEYAVWTVLLTYADADGSSAHPSQATLLLDTGLGRATVQRALDRLAAAGAIRRVGTSTRGVAVWHVVIDYAGPQESLPMKRSRWKVADQSGLPREAHPKGGTSIPRDTAPASQGRPAAASLGRLVPASQGRHNQTLLPDQRPDHSPLRAHEGPGVSAAAPPPVNSPHGSGEEPEVPDPAPPAVADPPIGAQPRQGAASAPTAPSGVRQDSPRADRPAAAAAARPPPDPNREPEDLPFAELVEVEARDLFERKCGSHIPAERRLAALATLVRDYRRRWPKSWPSDWGACSEMPGLAGPIKDRAAWVWTHVVGYGREGWKPENKDGSEREWHALLLEGRLGDALRAKQIEASYRGENTARAQAAHGRRATRTLMRLVAEDPALKSSVESAVTAVASERPIEGEMPHDLHRSRPAGSREARP